MKSVRKLIIHVKRGFLLFLFQLILLSLLFLINHTREWYLSVFFPLLGVGNMALAWFLYLRRDGFLHTRKKDHSPETMVCDPSVIEPDLTYEGAFLAAGLLFLALASLLYVVAGVGSRFYTPRTFL